APALRRRPARPLPPPRPPPGRVPPRPPPCPRPPSRLNRFKRYLLREVVLCGIAPTQRVSPSSRVAALVAQPGPPRSRTLVLSVILKVALPTAGLRKIGRAHA